MNTKYDKAIAAIVENGFWFVDIPRTSSSSIRIELGNQFGFPYGKKNLLESQYSSEQVFPDHLTAKEIIEIISLSNWENIYSFSIVRNPWDRVLSLFFYRKIKKNIPDNWSFSDYINELQRFKSNSKYFSYPGFYRGLVDYITDENNKILVNKIIKFENRSIGLKEISEKLAIKNLGIVHTQISKPIEVDYRRYYNNHTKKIIKELYKKDIELFDYVY